MDNKEKILEWIEGHIDDTWNIKVIHYESLKQFISSLNDSIELKKDSVESKKLQFTGLHEKLQCLLLVSIGKKQKTIQQKYAYLPNQKDLINCLQKFCTKYKYKNEENINKCLINYTKMCIYKNFEYVQLLRYYIMKDGNSQLMTDLENINDVEDFISQTNNFDGINI